MKLPFLFAVILLPACGGVANPSDGDGPGDADPGDPDVPRVLSTSPNDGAAGVAAASTITVAFSRPMDPASVEAAWQSTDLPREGVSFAWNAASDTVVVTPAQPLELAEGTGLDPSVVPARSYHVSIDTTARATAGAALAAPVALAFTTQRVMTVELEPIGVLTRSMRSDGVVFGETAVTLTHGDTTGNLQLKTFVTFALPVLPSGGVAERARLGANQNSTVGVPYALGKLVARHVSAATIDAAAFTASPLGTAGALSSDATAGAKTLDVSSEVLDDLANHAARGERTQFRLELEAATDNGADADEARFSRSGMTLTLVYSAE